FDAHRVEVGILDDDILLRLVLIAAHKVGSLDQTQLRVDRLHVDAVVRGLVQLVEADALAGTGSGIKPDRAADQAQLEIPFPACSGRHGCLLRDDATNYLGARDDRGNSRADSLMVAQASPDMVNSPGSEE